MTEKHIINTIIEFVNKEMRQAQADYYLFEIEFGDITKRMDELEKKKEISDEEHDKLLKQHFDLHSKIFENMGLQIAYEKIIDLITETLHERLSKN